MSIELVMLSNHLVLCHPLLLLPSVLPSVRVFSYESALCIRWPKYWSFSFSKSFQQIFRVDFLSDWLVWSPCFQGTIKSLLQHHNLKASILRHLVFFMVQFSYPDMTTEKTIALTTKTSVGKMMSLLSNILRLSQLSFQGASIFYFPGCNHCLQWLWSPRK